MEKNLQMEVIPILQSFKIVNKKKSGILRVVSTLGKLSFTFNNIRKDYIQMLVGRKRPSWAPVKED